MSKKYDDWLDAGGELPKSNGNQTHDSATRELPSPAKKDKKQSDNTRYDLTNEEIFSIDYGDLPPTFYRSPLSDKEWDDKYIIQDFELYPYQFGTDEAYEKAVEEEKAKWERADKEYLFKIRTMLRDYDDVLILMPRRYGKTEAMLKRFARWFLEVWKPLYMVGPSNSHDIGLLIRLEGFIKAPEIRRDYGDVIGKVSHGQAMQFFTYHADFRWMRIEHPLYMTTYMSGKEGWGPAWIHFEDCFQKDPKNLESIDDIKVKFSKTFANQRTRKRGQITKFSATGSRYGLMDFYRYLLDVRFFELLHIECMSDDETTFTYSPNYTHQDLIEKKAKDLWAFETNMNNRPIARGGLYFKGVWGDHNSYEWIDDNIGSRYMTCDPASGEEETSDFSAIIQGELRNGILYIIDGVEQRFTLDGLKAEIIERNAKFKPLKFWTEKIFSQNWLYQGIDHLLNMFPFRQTGKDAKFMRIESMEKALKQGYIKVNKNSKIHDIIHKQVLAYQTKKKSTPSYKIDVLDALAMMYVELAPYIGFSHKKDASWGTY